MFTVAQRLATHLVDAFDGIILLDISDRGLQSVQEIDDFV